MNLDYEKLEKDLEEACQALHEDFQRKFAQNDGYMSVGGAKLDAFMQGIQLEFENAALDFLSRNSLSNDPEARRRALTITKLYAKRCVEDFSRLN